MTPYDFSSSSYRLTLACSPSLGGFVLLRFPRVGATKAHCCAALTQLEHGLRRLHLTLRCRQIRQEWSLSSAPDPRSSAIMTQYAKIAVALSDDYLHTRKIVLGDKSVCFCRPLLRVVTISGLGGRKWNFERREAGYRGRIQYLRSTSWSIGPDQSSRTPSYVIKRLDKTSE